MRENQRQAWAWGAGGAGRERPVTGPAGREEEEKQEWKPGGRGEAGASPQGSARGLQDPRGSRKPWAEAREGEQRG